jgi:hypothetical protein
MAAGYNDFGTRIVPGKFPDSLAGLHPGPGCDRTGVDDAHIAVFPLFGPDHAFVFKACGNTV